MAIGPEDSVTVEYTGRLPDGTVFDTSREEVAEEAGLKDEAGDREFGPITFDVGSGRIIEGLEEALIGLEEGDTHSVTIPPEKAYGEWTDEHVQEYEAEEFRELIGGQSPEEGAYIQTQEGGVAEIIQADDEEVHVDFNHALAGETLDFDVEVIEIQ